MSTSCVSALDGTTTVVFRTAHRPIWFICQRTYDSISRWRVWPLHCRICYAFHEKPWCRIILKTPRTVLCVCKIILEMQRRKTWNALFRVRYCSTFISLAFFFIERKWIRVGGAINSDVADYYMSHSGWSTACSALHSPSGQIKWLFYGHTCKDLWFTFCQLPARPTDGKMLSIFSVLPKHSTVWTAAFTFKQQQVKPDSQKNKNNNVKNTFHFPKSWISAIWLTPWCHCHRKILQYSVL